MEITDQQKFKPVHVLTNDNMVFDEFTALVIMIGTFSKEVYWKFED